MEEQVVALVVSVEDVSQQTRAFREQTAELVQQWLSEQFELSPLIGVGTACRELSLLNRSLIEGLAMLEYRLQSHNGRILFFEDISQIQDQTNSYSLGEQVKFNQSLKLGTAPFVWKPLKDCWIVLLQRSNPFYCCAASASTWLIRCLNRCERCKLVLTGRKHDS